MNFIVNVLGLLLLLTLATSLNEWDVQATTSAAQVRERYIRYLFQQGKAETRVLDPKRLERFRLSLLFVEHQNKKVGEHFKVGLNEMSDWLEGELRGRFSAESLAATLTNDTSVTNSGSGRIGDGVQPGIKKEFTASSLNWAGTDNPLGRSILPPIRNQGTCGACWSFVAVAAVEASVHLNTNHDTPLPLSAQELIDCDTTFNRGCLGGNPLYAFEYTMVEGLTSWADYGYLEKVGSCQRKKYQAKASITGFVRVASNDQSALERAVTLSPVAVGVCGTDQGFIYYESGVFDARDCCTTQNHALLIVGYGHDSQLQLDYWLAQNSWGNSWGEYGYIRLLRSSTNSTGQCGLATSPCAAVGGYLMHPEREGLSGGEMDPQRIKRFQASVQIWLEAHWRQLMLVLSFSMFALSLWLLYCDKNSPRTE